MATRVERSILAMERLATYTGYSLQVVVERHHEGWIIKFIAGNAAIQASLDTFQKQPFSMIDPFGEELIKRNL